MSVNPDNGDLVVLTHGIASTKWLLLPLARRLAGYGFDARLYGYPSIRGSNCVLGERLAAHLHQLAAAHPDRKIHLVVHSMGSIVTRCALAAGVPESVGRIVMIGPPNRGSHVARRLAPITGWLSPTLVELSDAPNSFVNRLPLSMNGHEMGIITAAYDRMVRPESTLLEDHYGHITLPSLHTSILWRRRTAECVARFLKCGTFEEEALEAKLG